MIVEAPAAAVDLPGTKASDADGFAENGCEFERRKAGALPGNAEETRKRLLRAATAEFAARGIAGARIDRIAADAGANKAMIYAYFGNKEQLFTAVFDAQVLQTLETVPIDTSDLAEYAGRLYDYYSANPLVNRIAAWARLERGEGAPPVEMIVRANAGKVEAIASAQAAGAVPRRFSAAALLLLILSVAGMWTTMMDEYKTTLDAEGQFDNAARRAVIVDAVRLLLF